MTESLLSWPKKVLTRAVASGQGACETVENNGYHIGSVHLPASLTSSSFTWQVWNSARGAWVTCPDSQATANDGNVAAVTFATSSVKECPQELFSAEKFRIVFGSSETAGREVVWVLTGGGTTS